MREEHFPAAVPVDLPLTQPALRDFYALGWEAQRVMVRDLSTLLDQVEEANLPELLNVIYPREGAASMERLEPQTAQRLIGYVPLLVRREVAEPATRCRIAELVLEFLETCLDPARGSYSRAAIDALRMAAPALPEDVREERLLSLLLNLLHAAGNDLLRITALELLCDLLGLFSPAAFEGFFCADILAMMQDSRPEVKLAAFRTFLSVVDQIDKELLARKFLDVLTAMNNEYSNEIRVLFTQRMVVLVRQVPPEALPPLLASYLLNLESRNRFVREAAVAQLGQVILALPETEPTRERLIAEFFALPQTVARLGVSGRLPALQANYALLAQVAALPGADRWQQLIVMLRATETLESSLLRSAKASVAEQFEALAQDARFVRDLMPLIDKHYIADSPDEAVRLATLRALPTLLERIAPEKRERYADLFYETMSQDVRKWRTRLLVAGQASLLARLFLPDTLLSKILPLYFSFCRDPVAVVRKHAAAQFADFIAAVQLPQAREVAAMHMKAFGTHSYSGFRQAFVLMLQSLLACGAPIDEETRGTLLALAEDAVLPVRVQVALFLAEQHARLSAELLADVIQRLESCTDEDVLDALRLATGDERFPPKPYRALRFAASRPASLRGSICLPSAEEVSATP